MKNSNAKPISKEQMLERFDVLQYRYQVTGYKRVFRVSDTNSGEQYSGILYWDADDGFDIYWDGKSPMDYVEFEEFDYMLDLVLEEEHA